MELQILTKELFLDLKINQQKTYTDISKLTGLTERQISCKALKWGLNFSNKKKCDDEYFSQTNSLSVNYWAGVLAADGWVEEDRNRVGLAFKASDIGHLEKFKKALSLEHDICSFMNNTAFRIRFNSAKIVHDLRSNFNVTGQKTFTYTMPIFEDTDLLLEFLRGYIDGDGHLEKLTEKNIRLHLCSANKSFIQEYRELVELLVGRKTNRKIQEQTNVAVLYSQTFNTIDSKDILDLIYKNSTVETRLDRKYETYLKSC